MSLQWTAIATFLYIEIALTAILLLPIVNATRWQKIFASRLFGAIRPRANYIFGMLIFLLALCFMDAIKDIRKYDAEGKKLTGMSTLPNTIEHAHLKLFRAQRNFYIAGFSLFLWFVLRRLVTLIDTEASLIKSLKAANKRNTADVPAEPSAPEETDSDLELKRAQEELARVKSELDEMRHKSKDAEAEYDQLTEDYQKLQREYEAEVSNAAGDKKSD